MRAIVPDQLEKGRLAGDAGGYPRQFFGAFIVKFGPTASHLRVIACAGDPEVWQEAGLYGPPFDHVSVSVESHRRCPIWEEMCFVKDLCWDPEELVIQYHPPASRYVNHHPFCLHLWKPVGVTIPLPPTATLAR